MNGNFGETGEDRRQAFFRWRDNSFTLTLRRRMA
jgi:hypothetical protein